VNAASRPKRWSQRTRRPAPDPDGACARTAAEEKAVAYDIPGAPFEHDGEHCSFDAFIERFALKAPGLDHVAKIVRGADTSRLDLTPQSAGLYAISLGLSRNFADDHEMLRHGVVMYDALYAWAAALQDETHNWPPKPT